MDKKHLQPSVSRIRQPTNFTSSAEAPEKMLKAGTKRKVDDVEPETRNVRAKTVDNAPSTPVKPFTAKPAPARATAASTRATATKTATVTKKTTTAPKKTAPAAKAAAPASSKTPAPWDYKGKAAATEAKAAKLKEDLRSKEEINAELSGRVTELERKASQLVTAEQRIEELEQQSDALDVEVKKFKRELATANARLNESNKENEILVQEIAGLQAKIKTNERKISLLEQEKKTLEQSLADSQEESAQRLTTIHQLQSTVREREVTISERDSMIANLEFKRREEELLRRKLHNMIQELKGNIRVFCRVRPLLSSEKAQLGEVQHFMFPEGCDNMKLDVVGPSTTSVTGKIEAGKKYNYSFDKVFAPGTAQCVVFEEISQLVQSALDGYKVCIFAYGSTGSGKTFTMEGPSVTHPDHKGMIPRAVEQIFESSKTLIEQGWSYEFDVSFLEIYNERVRDLFHDRDEVDEKKYEIKMDTVTKTTEVTNLEKVTVQTPTEVYSLLKTAASNRSVAATKCNDRSSRSHSVFILKITGKNDVTGQVTKGQLNLIDLAGSERLALSGATGKAKEETQHINTSLFTLSKVISALANKASHIPYRDSALTKLLQPCLGGDAKTLMFVNVSPLPEHFNESLNSLRFATQVNACEVGTAKRKVGSS